MDTIWDTTVSRWEQEGLPKGESTAEYFELDRWVKIGGDISLQLPSKTIEDTEKYVISRNSNGAVTKRWKKSTSTPELIDFRITNRRGWEEHKERIRYNESRVDYKKAKDDFKNGRDTGSSVQYANGIGYDWWQRIVGPTNMLIGMKDDPEWIKEMYKANADLNIIIMEEMMTRGIKFDSAFFWDDLGYRNGTFFSPAMYRELLFPYHRRLCDFCNERQMTAILHSCGNVSSFLPMLIEAGFGCIQPLEVKAGMDLLRLKSKYGEKISLMGGIDVRAMAQEGKALEREVKEKITSAKKGGGYIYHSDHSVPDNVSFQSYSKLISLVREYGKY